jgi:hypothetical protein
VADERELIFSDIAGGHVGWQPAVVPRASAISIPAAIDLHIIGAMSAFWIVAILGGTSRPAAAVLELAFAPAAFAMGFWLWRVSAGAFLSFIWQLFFFTCLIRRLADFQLGWNAMNPIIVAPYLTALWCCATLLRPGRAFLRSFGLVAAALLWALAIGIMRNGISAAGFSMLEWSVGPLIAGYLVAIPGELNRVKSSLFWTAIVGVIVMALYGIVQYVAPPVWDRYWIYYANMASVIGLEPGKLRVFSTMNSPWPFATTLLALLVFVMGSRGWLPLRALAVASGLIALIASQTRAAWGGLLIGWVVLVIVAGRARWTLLAMAGLLAVIGGLAVVAMPSTRGLTARVETLGSLGSDDSLSVRARFYQSFFIEAMGQPIGAGLGRTGVATRLSQDASMLHFDSGLMNVPYVLGWLGTIAYAGGLGVMIVAVTWRWRQLSPVGLASGAACAALLSQMIFLNSVVAASGVMFWTLLGVCLLDIRSDQPAEAISRRKSLAGK